MNSLKLETGGRPFTNDDLATLQANLPLLCLPALLAGIGPCVVNGCRLSGNGPAYNVGAGIVWDGNSHMLHFSGRGAATLPLMFQAGAATAVNQRPYQTEVTKTCITDQQMELVPVVAGAPNLVLNPYGALTDWHR